MSNELFKVIEQPTEHKKPGEHGDSFGSDFDTPEVPKPQPRETVHSDLFEVKGGGNYQAPEPQYPAPVNDTITIPPSESADIAISLMDGTQGALFTMLIAKKLRKKIFADQDEFRNAMALQYLTADLTDEQKALQSKAKLYTKQLNERTAQIEFQPDEEARLKPPVKKMMERYNWDLPPGLAFALVFGQIMSERVFTLLEE